MQRKINIIGITLFFTLALFSLAFSQEESFTITTYYPSPYGSYNELRANQMSIGSGYATSTLSNGKLIVEGNVGIGTTDPQGRLDLSGGPLAVGGNPGTAGQYLKSQGPGQTPVWAASQQAPFLVSGTVTSGTCTTYCQNNGNKICAFALYWGGPFGGTYLVNCTYSISGGNIITCACWP